jgi:peptidyl-prolyl cis-trans isomerase-like 4
VNEWCVIEHVKDTIIVQKRLYYRASFLRSDLFFNHSFVKKQQKKCYCILFTTQPYHGITGSCGSQTNNYSTMSILLETTLGDLVIDLDVDGSPALCKNILKLCKARYYTENLVYNVQPNRFFQLGDPRGDGIGGACIYGVLDAYDTARKANDNLQQKHNNMKPNVMLSKRRFLKSDMGRPLTENECQQRGRVVATELGGIADTIGSQLLITIADGPDRALDGFRNNHNNDSDYNNNNATTSNEPLTAQIFRSVGTVVEDDNDVLTKMNSAYCDANGRPYADVRVIRALVIDDPFDDPTGMDQLLVDRGVTVVKANVDDDDDDDNDDDNKQKDDDDDETIYKVMASPEYERPPEEIVETRIRADQIDDNADDEIDLEKIRKQEEERYKREDKSRAVVLEMLGDLPSADMTAPENVLFVCKLNPVTEDDDLDLIFSRFDEKVKADIVRDSKTGASLQYAFVEFTTKERATEAYFKMNNALVDDRRIKVDFSQSVSKVWDRFNQVKRRGSSSSNKKNNNDNAMPRDPFKEQKLPSGRQQQQQKQAPRRDNRFGNSNNTSNEYRRGGNNPSNDHNQRHRYQRDDRQHHSSSDNRERNRDGNNVVDSRNRERDYSHRDRRDNRTHPAQRNRDRDRDRDHHSIDDEDDRRRPTRARQASPENDHRSGSKYEERYRRGDRDQRRRSRSRSRSDDDDEKRERKRSRKKSSHRKHEKRDRKHSRHREDRHHKERDSGSRHRRRSPSSSV